VLASCQRESGAARGTREAAEFLALEGRARELEHFADDAIRDLAPKRWKPHPGLPDPTVPVERLPKKFRELGGAFVGPPNVVLDSKRQAVVLQWGNGRHEIVVFVEAPAAQPPGSLTRKVNERIYVTAMSE
jgi:hypothetical protein